MILIEDGGYIYTQKFENSVGINEVFVKVSYLIHKANKIASLSANNINDFNI